MFDVRCLIFDVKKKLRSRCALRTSTIKHPTSNIHDGLTLIELLVVIVILTTLVAGVIPILSPNNDTRKIREATRMLQTYIVQAQAEAARTGRDQGIAFQESSAGSGVSLDVFRLEVPPSFFGFSSASRVTVEARTTNPLVYGSGGTGNGGTNFFTQYNGAPLYDIRFVLAATSASDPDRFPPRMFRIGDQINVDGNVFLVVDDSDPDSHPNLITTVNSVDYLESGNGTTDPTQCIWLNSNGQLLSQGEKQYQFTRQPSNSAESPMQFPAGIAIDMQGSVAEGSSTGGFLTDESLDINSATDADTVGIMFSPTGSVSSVLLNGTSLTNVSRIALLLGRVENGGLVDSSEWTIAEDASTDELSELQAKINWLNLDSRWLMIMASSGRVVVSDNAFVDARDTGLVGTNDFKTAEFQIEAAHAFAREMRSGGAGR